MDKIRKGSDLRKEKWESPSIQESKIAAKFSQRLSICTVPSLRDISEKTWVHSYPIMPHAFTFQFAPFASCLPSCDMREKMSSSNGRERPQSELVADRSTSFPGSLFSASLFSRTRESEKRDPGN